MTAPVASATPLSTALPGAPGAPRSGPVIEPTLALALALRATPGAYALLVGSGLSSAAGIPTGWGIVLDLIRKIAPPGTADAPGGLEGWYRTSYGEEPDYAKLLAVVARTPGERRDLLRGYFEPTDEERTEGKKAPTRAHRAIARLAAGGYVRVIVTTNFDQLLETALRDAGVSPAVISTPDARAGAMPLQHERVTVIKVHGDFMDVRIKNTPEELAKYHRSMNGLLNRVFDEYGLVVCGWSAAWDDALRAAITRAPSRRFSMFWAQRGPLAPEAERLIAHRHGTLVPVAGADEFFEAVAEKVASLEDLDARHPVSTAVAVASLKRYLPRPEERIRLDDLVMGEVEAVRRRAAEIVPVEAPSKDNIGPAIERLDAASGTMMALAAAGAQWWEPRHAPVWRRALERLGNLSRPPGAGHANYTFWPEVLRYPAQLAFYAFGVTAAAAGHDDALGHLLLDLHVEVPTERRTIAAYALNWAKVLGDNAKILPGYEKRVMAASDHLFAVVRPTVEPYVAADAVYEAAFERFELLAALGYMHELRVERGDDPWFPAGRAWYRRHGAGYGRQHAIGLLGEEIARDGKNWFLLRRGLFDGSPETLDAMYRRLVEQTNRYIG